MTKMSAVSRSPALLAWTASPHLGLSTTTVVSVAAGHLDLDLADAHRLDEHEREAGRGEHPDRLGDGDGQPAEMARATPSSG